MYGDSTSGNRAVYELGLSGVPVFNTNNNCSTGSTALMMAQQFVAGGMSDCVLAVGFEKMQRGSLAIGSEVRGTQACTTPAAPHGHGRDELQDRENPLEKHMNRMAELVGGFEKAPPAPWLFACAGRWHMDKYGTSPEAFAKVAEKNHRHSVNNPYAQFRDEYTLDEVLASKAISYPLTVRWEAAETHVWCVPVCWGPRRFISVVLCACRRCSNARRHRTDQPQQCWSASGLSWSTGWKTKRLRLWRRR